MTEDKRHTPRLDRLYRQAADVEPDRRIDEAVLGESRSAASSPRRRTLRRPGAWGAGLAAAASLVLAVGLVFQYGWQPTPETGRLEHFRAKAEMEQTDKPSAPAAGDSIERQDGGEPAAIEESTELNRLPVAGARTREAGDRDGQKSRKPEPDEAHLASPPPVDEGERLGPEAWLERIRALAEAEKLDEARQEMRDFRDAYPSVRIPIEIRNALATDAE